MYHISLAAQELAQKIQFAQEHKDEKFSTKETLFEYMIQNHSSSMSFCNDGFPQQYSLVTKELFDELFKLGENATSVATGIGWEHRYHVIEHKGNFFRITSSKTYLSMDYQEFVEIQKVANSHSKLFP